MNRLTGRVPSVHAGVLGRTAVLDMTLPCLPHVRQQNKDEERHCHLALLQQACIWHWGQVKRHKRTAAWLLHELKVHMLHACTRAPWRWLTLLCVGHRSSLQSRRSMQHNEPTGGRARHRVERFATPGLDLCCQLTTLLCTSRT